MNNDTSDNIIIYQSPDGAATLAVRLDHETVWLTQKQMAELFGKNSDTIGLHIRNAYKERELAEEGTTEESSVVQNEGSRRIHRKIRFYNLDVIITVGYRVKSQQGTRFRQWATQILKDHTASRKRGPISSTSLSRTTPSATATSGSPLPCLSTSSA